MLTQFLAVKNLARTHNILVIASIHQPNWETFALFDKLLLLASGRVVYSGDFPKCHEYFKEIGHPCPAGYNIADFLSAFYLVSLSNAFLGEWPQST